MLRGLRVLFLTTVLPRKQRMGSEVASQMVIDALTKLGAEVTVVGYIRTGDNYDPSALEVCAGRRHIETKGAGTRAAMWFFYSLLARLPYSVAKYCSSAFVSVVRKSLRQENHDFVVLDHVQMSWLIEAVPLTGKLIGIAHNVEHQMYQTFVGEQSSDIRRGVYQRESRLLRDMEITFADKLDQLWVLTKNDAESFALFKQKASVKVISLSGSAGPSDGIVVKKAFDIGLVGSWTWKANEQGLKWFLEEIYPHLSADLAIHVAGSGAKWLEGRYGNVKYLGFVDDVRHFLQQARVVAIPTLSGGGIQIKTLDAIASGSQIVATPLALRGINDHPPTVRVTENPQEFAQLLCSAMTSLSSADSSRAIEWSRLRQSRFLSEVGSSVQSLVSMR